LKNPLSGIFKNFNFQIFTNLGAKSKFFDSFCLNFNVCTYKRHFFFIFGLILPKIEKFCQKSENFGNFSKIGTFSKNNIKK
jgi:hypothetical protein